ncbi:MAG: riboflavin biosynthesis protein RibF [Chlorobia bacterium]|nr:riboflavin biosynthesis protein RibF [Fimbriimonadaceae bacterium]
MQVHFGEELLRAEWTDAVGCLGTFDGVHLGHQQVISTAVSRAREKGLPCVLITFDRHPAAVLAPEKCPKAIAPLSSNLKAFESLGVSVALILPFTQSLSETTAQAFLDEVFIGEAKTRHLVVGHDFAFGKGREGTTDWLQAKIDTEIVPPFEMDGQRVSSSAIRRSIEVGDMIPAKKWLGRPFSLNGIVVAGQRLGRQLGFPTVNLARSYDGVVPQDGIYSGFAHTSLGGFRAAISIGMRPTVDGNHRTIEAYLLNYPGTEIYGTSVDLEFYRRLRNEERFDSLDDLKIQMARDVEAVANDIALR